MSIWHIYMLGSIRIHKHLRCPCMPEYGSESRTLCIYVCICICEACERCLSKALGVMKVIGIDFVVVLIFYSFNNAFVSCWVYKIFVCEWIGLLSDYHNMIVDDMRRTWLQLMCCKVEFGRGSQSLVRGAIQ